MGPLFSLRRVGLLWVKCSLSVSRKYYHLRGWFRGITVTSSSPYASEIVITIPENAALGDRKYELIVDDVG